MVFVAAMIIVQLHVNVQPLSYKKSSQSKSDAERVPTRKAVYVLAAIDTVLPELSVSSRGLIGIVFLF